MNTITTTDLQSLLTADENEIKDVLEQTLHKWHINELQGDKNWTTFIKQSLHDLGIKKTYKVCTNGVVCDHGEWLYDLVWYQENSNGRLVSVPLVLESEWKRDFGNIKYDFEKLLLANAITRVMICQAYSRNIEGLKEYFRNAVNDYNLLKKGDRFFVAILDDFDTGEFIYDLIIKL